MKSPCREKQPFLPRATHGVRPHGGRHMKRQRLLFNMTLSLTRRCCRKQQECLPANVCKALIVVGRQLPTTPSPPHRYRQRPRWRLPSFSAFSHQRHHAATPPPPSSLPPDARSARAAFAAAAASAHAAAATPLHMRAARRRASATLPPCFSQMFAMLRAAVMLKCRAALTQARQRRSRAVADALSGCTGAKSSARWRIGATTMSLSARQIAPPTGAGCRVDRRSPMTICRRALPSSHGLRRGIAKAASNAVVRPGAPYRERYAHHIHTP